MDDLDPGLVNRPASKAQSSACPAVSDPWIPTTTGEALTGVEGAVSQSPADRLRDASRPGSPIRGAVAHRPQTAGPDDEEVNSVRCVQQGGDR